MNQSFAVLVLSCDKYSDVWPAFFKCFRENFPAGDWPVYLGSNTKECNEPGVTTILSGSDPDWSTSYKRILEQMPQRKLFVILEDQLLSSKVDENTLGTLVDFLFEKEANHIRYWANPAPDLPTDNPLIGECATGAPYRSTVCGFWDRKYLLGLLLEGENPWNFEIIGSYRTSSSNGFYATTSPLCEYKNMIEKGRWIPASVDWANRNGISLPLEARPMLMGGNQLISRLQMSVFKIMMNIPWKYRVKLMNHFRKLFISY
jgi:hypothetical protein